MEKSKNLIDIDPSKKWDSPSHDRSNVRQHNIPCEKYNHTNSTTTGSIADFEAVVSSSNETIKAIKTKPTSPPGKPEVWQMTNTTIGIKWSKPSDIGPQCAIAKYVIKEQQDQCDAWDETSSSTDGDCEATLKVKPNVTYKFKVYCDCGASGKSLDSEPSEDILIKLITKECLHAKLLQKSNLMPGNPNIYELILTTVTRNDNNKQIRKYEFGSQMKVVAEKVILVVGATGSGKTTLINGLINYIFAVDWNDNFRFKLINEPGSQNQAESQTKCISSYTIHHQVGFRIPYTLTIVDTPGFGDISGIEKDNKMTQEIRSLFTTPGVGGFDHLDAVGFVVQSCLPRLTPTQKYIFEHILSLFGKNIDENIFMFLTFADFQEAPILSGIHEANIPFNKSFNINNSALYVSKPQPENTGQENNDDDDVVGNFDEAFWKIGEKSFDIFLEELNRTESRRFQLTMSGICERKQLEVKVSGIRINIQRSLAKLKQLKEEVNILTTHQSDIDRNKDVTYTVNEEISPYQFVSKQISVTEKTENLRQRYQEASEKQLSAENLISKVQDEIQVVNQKLLGMKETEKKLLDLLKEIPLILSHLSTTEYINILNEYENSNPRWQSQCEQFQYVKKQAEYMKKLADKGFDPFEDYMAKQELEKKSNILSLQTLLRICKYTKKCSINLLQPLLLICRYSRKCIIKLLQAPFRFLRCILSYIINYFN